MQFSTIDSESTGQMPDQGHVKIIMRICKLPSGLTIIAVATFCDHILSPSLWMVNLFLDSRCYVLSLFALYFACRIFSVGSNQSIFKTGFSDWKHVTERRVEHENSNYHRNSISTYISSALESE